MEKFSSVITSRTSRLSVRPQHIRTFVFRISSFAFLFAAGCGAPGEPTPPSPPVPTTVTDLSAQQAGDGTMITFTLPTRTVVGERLSTPPAVEILRGNVKSDGSPDAKSFRVVYTLPGALTDTYTSKNVLQYIDPISPEETKSHPGAPLVYRVRTRASQKRASADSNIAIVRIFPVPKPIYSLETRVTESAIELTWTAPTSTSAGDLLPAILGYRVYRGEMNQSSPDSVHDSSSTKNLSNLKLLASPDSNSYRDIAFEFGKAYVFIVRTAVLVDGNPLESSDSNRVVVAPMDTFPPAAPRNVVAAVLPGPDSNTLLVDLSWSINVEPDLAGYRVYRSEEQNTRGQALDTELLPTPSYRDTSVLPGHRYWYTVTSLDRAGNESSNSSSVLAEITQPSP